MSETEAQAPEPQAEAPEVSGPSGSPKTESGTTSSQPSASQSGEAKEQGTAPWAKDLADRGIADPNVDAYLREVWQPRMTQFEQQMSQWDQLFGGDMERAQIMAGLADALEHDPAGTYEEIGRLLGLVTDGEYDDAQADEGMQDGEYDEGENELSQYRQWIEEQMEQQKIMEQDIAYEDLLNHLETENPGFDRDLFHAAIVAFDGDPDMAFEWYMKYHRAPEPPAEFDGPDPMGESNPAPPEAKEYSGIGDAIADFMSDMKTAKGAR